MDILLFMSLRNAGAAPNHCINAGLEFLMTRPRGARILRLKERTIVVVLIVAAPAGTAFWWRYEHETIVIKPAAQLVAEIDADLRREGAGRTVNGGGCRVELVNANGSVTIAGE